MFRQLATTGYNLTSSDRNRSWTPGLEDQLEYEAYLQPTAATTEDHIEGVTAFLEKRKPQFKGR